MKTIYNTLILASLLFFTYSGFAQTDGLPLFDYDGKTIIHGEMDIMEEPIQELSTPIVNSDSMPSATALFPGDRLVFWVHGLAGNFSTWKKAAHASGHNVQLSSFPPRKIESYSNIKYIEDYDLKTAGMDLHETIQFPLSITDEPDQSFIIAHSQGGLVTRAYYNQLVCLNSYGFDILDYIPNGFVTFSSPHQGAQILNSALDRTVWTPKGKMTKFDIFSEDLTYKLTLGPAHGFVRGLEIKLFDIIPYWVGFSLEKLITYEIIESLVGEIAGGVQLGVANVIAPMFTPGITKDYKVNSPTGVLDALNVGCEKYNKNVHKIAFYGVEPQEHIFGRTLHYILDDPNNGAAERNHLPDYSYFAANEDFLLVNKLNEFQDNYRSKKESFEELVRKNELRYDQLRCKYYEPFFKSKGGWLAFWYNPKAVAECSACKVGYERIERDKKIAKAFEDGENWFNSVDRQWQDIIGALELIPIPTGFKQCECENQEKLGDVVTITLKPNESCEKEGVVKMGDGDWDCWEIGGSTIAGYRLRIKPNDGVVLAESQRALPYMTLKDDIDPKEDLRMESSSHMQVRNNEALMHKLTALYDGDYDLFFKTEERD